MDRQVCYLCKRRTGACIQCSKSNCYVAYHATCARDYGLYLKLGTSSGTTHGDDEPTSNISYCDKHSRNMRDGTGTPLTATAREGSIELPSPDQIALFKRSFINSKNKKRGSKLNPLASSSSRGSAPPPPPAPVPVQAHGSKANRAYRKSFTSAGPPVIPQYIYKKLCDYVRLFSFKKKQHLLKLICRYWSLKREARRGAPLLKRLHLEVRTLLMQPLMVAYRKSNNSMAFCFPLRCDRPRTPPRIALDSLEHSATGE